jgi:sec-independent protein translocase protein TatA
MMLLPSVAILGGSLGSGEVLVILLVALIVFGPHKLPALARTLGRLLNDIRRSAHEFTDELTRAANEDRPAAAPPHQAQPSQKSSAAEPRE